jgi:feruloyl esterase
MVAGCAAVLLMCAAPATAATCESLSATMLPQGAVTSAQVVGAGMFIPPSSRGGAAAASAYKTIPAFCRIQATLRPSADSDIRIEVWMPTDGWNGRFQAVGNRGWGGAIMYPALAAAVASGYAAASTDTGHVGGDASFALGHPEKVVDAAYRAVHEMTAQAKSIIAGFYGGGPKRSYFNGCSLGGRQGLSEAQRYPDDFDGIVVGDPAHNLTNLYTARVAVAAAVHRSAASFIPRAKYAVIHRAVLDACDARDGARDGVLENPAACQFDPKVLACSGEDAASCLTADQVETARHLYSDTLDPRSSRIVSRGRPPGSELGWAIVAGPVPDDNATDMFKYIVYQDPNWDWKTFELRGALDAASRPDVAVLDATDTNLRPFFDRGGKLLMYHGWADPQTPAGNSIDYYTRARAASGPKAADSMRLFLVPGMGHCAGGSGTDTFDKMAPLVEWVENGRAPTRIPASRVVDGKVVRTRPLCPYGEVARWNGSGSMDDAANFACVPAMPRP